MTSSVSAHTLYRRLEETLEQGRSAVIATVIETRGSTPQRSGAKLVVFEDGDMFGTVGGGCVEAEVWARARDVLRRGKSGLFTFVLNDHPEQEDGDVCGGTMKIYLDLWTPDR